MASADSCNVCVELFNKSNRKPIGCAHCGFEACASCVCRVLLDSSKDPHCMQCAKEWNKDFIVENFTKKFVNDTLKKHREQQLFEREQGMLPATQPAVEREIEKEHLTNRLPALTERKKQLKIELKEIEAEIAQIHRNVARINIAHAVGAQQGVLKEDRRQFVRRCPVGDCLGFLSTAWKCGLCQNWACPECHEVKGANKDAPHECKPENVETAKLLAKDTKPCPKCAVPIHRIAGCNQMFCTNCHTPFDWVTLRVERGVIHNPHYFEMRQRLGAAAPDVEMQQMVCGERPPTIQALMHALHNKHKVGLEVLGMDMRRFMEWISHMYGAERQRYMVDNLNDNVDLRIKYMMKKIDETRFKQLLQQREKARMKKQEIEQVIASTFTLAMDILRMIMSAPSLNRIRKHVKELKSLVPMAEEGMDKIARKYNCTVPDMSYDFQATGLLPHQVANRYYYY